MGSKADQTKTFDERLFVIEQDDIKLTQEKIEDANEDKFEILVV